MGKRIGDFFSAFWLCLMAFSHFSLQLSPAVWGGNLGLFYFSIPLIFLVACLFWLYWLFRRNYFWLSAFTLLLLLSHSFLSRSYAFRFTSPQNPDFQVLSYNVQVFNSYPHLAAAKPESSAEMLRWLAEHSAEIKCLQEFYHLQGSAEFNTIERLAQSQNYHYWAGVSPEVLANNKGFFGNIILSKYPFAEKGIFEHQGKKFGLYADVVFPQDTLRIINVHLQSMHLNLQQMTWEQIIPKLQKGLQYRALQCDLLVEHIRESPHPVLLSGDLNEVPFGYVYEQLSWQLENNFEQSNAGFGISYLGKIPLLRIDHQFYSRQALEAENLSLQENQHYSDHSALIGDYRFLPRN